MDRTGEQVVNNHQIKIDAIKNRVEMVKAAHANDSVTVTPDINNPVKQQSNNEALRTCLVASSINAMKALGYSNPPSEEEMTTELIKNEPPDSSGELRVRALLDYLESKGFTTKSIWGYPQELVDGLLAGNCAIQLVTAKSVKTRSHATLIAGITIDKGRIRITQFDPDPSQPPTKEYSLEEHIDQLYQEDELTGLWLISKKTSPGK